MAALLLAAAGSAAAAATGPASTPCWLRDWPQAARCGVLKRPLDPARPDGVLIELHYAVLPALARHKAEDAVFFLAGGPGQSAIELGGALAGRFARLNQRRDLVFVDQRGTGRSAPLRCADDAPRAVLQPLAERNDEAQRLPRLRACLQSLQALPYGDLRFYTTEIAMADLDAVRDIMFASDFGPEADQAVPGLRQVRKLFPEGRLHLLHVTGKSGRKKRFVMPWKLPNTRHCPGFLTIQNASLISCGAVSYCPRQPRQGLRRNWQP